MLDLPVGMDVDEGRMKNREKRPDDIFILVKEYICSVQLAQNPLLALPAEARETFPMTTSRHKLQ